jgi:hypothetical protein
MPNDSPPDLTPEASTLVELKRRLGRVKALQQGHESYHRRFARMQDEIDQLKKRVQRLEGTDSP